MRSNWEYKVLELHTTNPRATQEMIMELNAQGLEGWELVAVVEPRYYLKRSRLEASANQTNRAA
jgi:hypothetical protein